MTTCSGISICVVYTFEVETYRVENDTEFEYQKSSNLLFVSLSLCRFEFLEDNGILDLVYVVTKSSVRFAAGTCNVFMAFLLSLDLSTSSGFDIIVLENDRREVACIRVSVAD